jgi:hypothetical protein
MEEQEPFFPPSFIEELKRVFKIFLMALAMPFPYPKPDVKSGLIKASVVGLRIGMYGVVMITIRTAFKAVVTVLTKQPCDKCQAYFDTLTPVEELYRTLHGGVRRYGLIYCCDDCAPSAQS